MKKSFEKSSSLTRKVLRTLAGCLMIAMLVGLIPGRTVLAEEEKTISSKKVTYQKRDDGRGIRGNMSFEEFLSDGFKELVNEQVTVTLVWDDGSTSILDPSMYDIVLFCYAADEEDSIYLPDMYLKDIDEEAVNTLRSYAEYDYFDITFGIMTNDSFCYDNRWIVDGSTIEWTKLYEEDDINTLIKSGNIGERSMVENRIDMAGENPYLYLDFVLTDPKRGKEFRAEDCEIAYYDRVTEEKITADFLGPGYYTMKVSIPAVYTAVC